MLFARQARFEIRVIMTVMNCHFHNVEISFLSAAAFNLFQKSDNSFDFDSSSVILSLSTKLNLY